MRSRRCFLGGAGGIGIVALSGCLGSSDGIGDEDAEETVEQYFEALDQKNTEMHNEVTHPRLHVDGEFAAADNYDINEIESVSIETYIQRESTISDLDGQELEQKVARAENRIDEILDEIESKEYQLVYYRVIAEDLEPIELEEHALVVRVNDELVIYTTQHAP